MLIKYIAKVDNDMIVLPNGVPKNLEFVLDEGIAFELGTNGEIATSLTPQNSFLMYFFLRKFHHLFEISDDDAKAIEEKAKECNPFPKVELSNSYGGSLLVHVPPFSSYKKLLGDIQAYHKRLNTYSVPLGRLYNTLHLLEGFEHPFLPPPLVDKRTQEAVRTPLTKRGDLYAFFSANFEDLVSVRYGYRLDYKNGFKKLGIESLPDLVLRRPRKYKNYGDIRHLRKSEFGVNLVFKVKIDKWDIGYQGRATVHATEHETGVPLVLKVWGGSDFQSKRFPKGTVCLVEGKRIGRNEITVSEFVPEIFTRGYPILPIYDQSPKYGVTTKVQMSAIEETLIRTKNPESFFSYLKDEGYPDFWRAVENLHFPKDREEYLESLDTLAAYELFFIRLLFTLEEDNARAESKGIVLNNKEGGYFERALKGLPYKLTDDQLNALKEIKAHTRKKESNNILLSANVGYGKTIVALLTLLHAVDNGLQGCLLAPTEILAQQLYKGLEELLESMPGQKPKIAFYSGGVPQKELKEISDKVKNGDLDIVVGTHGLASLEWHNLGFIIVDEEQKFGQDIKAKLQEDRPDGKRPWFMTQTATAIPRSLAMTLYGNTKLVTMHNPPAGRKEIKTEWIKEDSKKFVKGKTKGFKQVNKLIEEQINLGKKVFVVCPAVEDNEEASFISVNEAKRELEKSLGIKPLTIHGKLKKETQERTMKRFETNDDYPLLIGSSIIEVGINQPKATVIIVLDADRFGCSALHQLRGRVGRDGSQGYCFLVSNKTDGIAESRLSILVETNDGFRIAEVDLKTRKEGDVFGSRQHGRNNFRFCDLTNIEDLLPLADATAQSVYESEHSMRAIQDAKLFLGLGHSDAK